MRTKTIELFTINELSDKAKEKAHENYLNEDREYVWENENRDSLDAFEDVFPIKVTNWSYDSYSGYISLRMETDYDEMSGHRLATYIYNNYWHSITKGKYYSLWSKTEKSPNNPNMAKLKTRYSKVMIVTEGACPLTGYVADDVLLEPIFCFLKKPDNTTFKELMQECLDAWIKYCVDDRSYQDSLEYFIETAQANEWEFTKDGEIEY